MSTELLREVEKFLLTTPVTPSRLGRDSVKDPSFVRELRLGRAVRPATEQRVRSYLLEKSKSQA